MELTREAFSYPPQSAWPVLLSFLCVPRRLQLGVAFVTFVSFGCGDGEVVHAPWSEPTRREDDVKGRKVVRRDGAMIDTRASTGSRDSTGWCKPDQ